MFKNKKVVLGSAVAFFAVLISLVVAYGGPLWSYVSNLRSEPLTVEENGDPKFQLPQGRQVYRIVQAAEVWPRILEAIIDPPDVHVGDMQKLEIVVQSPNSITSVEARIELDNEVKILPLKFVGEVASADLTPNPYYVDKGGKLAMRKDAGSQLAEGPSMAVAADYPKLKYAAEWKVYDTHDAKYHTTFVVKDSGGNENSITLAWSDACAIPLTGNWSLASYGNCTISSTDGVENGTTTIATYTLTLNSTFVYNPGQKFVINSGAIALGASGQIRQTYLWQTDADNDNWPGSSTQVAQDTTPASGKRRGSLATATLDCNDNSSTRWQELDGYRDADGDGYYGTTANNICSGNSLPSGYSSTNNDCLDSGTGAANVYQNVSVAQDSDGDNYYTGSVATRCVGAPKPACVGTTACLKIGNECSTYNPRGLDGNYKDTAGNYTWIASGSASGGSDCNDSDENSYTSASGVSLDNDKDGYISGTTNSTQCGKAATSVGGRTYYWVGCSNYVVYSQRLGTSDCNDDNGYIYATGGGGSDNNHDGAVQEAAVQTGLCVGNSYQGGNTWYMDGNGSYCWIRASAIGSYNQSSAADGGGLCARN